MELEGEVGLGGEGQGEGKGQLQLAAPEELTGEWQST